MAGGLPTRWWPPAHLNADAPCERRGSRPLSAQDPAPMWVSLTASGQRDGSGRAVAATDSEGRQDGRKHQGATHAPPNPETPILRDPGVMQRDAGAAHSGWSRDLDPSSPRYVEAPETTGRSRRQWSAGRPTPLRGPGERQDQPSSTKCNEPGHRTPEDSGESLEPKQRPSATLTPEALETPLLSHSGVSTGHSDLDRRRSGRQMPNWTSEAVDFATGLDEKRRLCAGSGYRSGLAHLRPVVG